MTGKSKPRLVRPVERQPMRDWLLTKLESKEIPGLEWMDRKRKIFRIKWCHGSRHSWSVKDSVLFEQWAIHSGRWNNGDHRRWKANFRCALNSLRTIEEIKDLSISKGQNAFRVFRMLPCPKGADKGSASNKADDEDDGYSRTSSESSVSAASSVSRRTSPRTSKPPTAKFTDCDMTQNFEDGESESEGYETDIQDGASVECHLADTEDNTFTSLSSVSSSSSSAVDETILDLFPSSSSSTNIPNFEKISPGISRFEFGKMHCLPAHNAGFKVDKLKDPPPLLPVVQFSQSPSFSTEIGDQTMQAIDTPSFLPDIMTSPSGMMSHGVDDQQSSAVSVQLYGSANFPDTPEGSEGSFEGNLETYVQVVICEREGTESSSIGSQNVFQNLPTSSDTPLQSMTSLLTRQPELTPIQVSSDPNQAVFYVVKTNNGQYCPLTPP